MANATLNKLDADFNIGVRPHVVEPLRKALARVAPSLELNAERGAWPTWPAKTRRREDLIRVSVRISDISQASLVRTALMFARFDNNVGATDIFHHTVMTDWTDNDSIIKVTESKYDNEG